MKHLIVMLAFWVMMTPYDKVNGDYVSLATEGSKNYFNLDNADFISYGINKNGLEVYSILVGKESLLFIKQEDTAKIKEYLDR
jgi:hypothetical protein